MSNAEEVSADGWMARKVLFEKVAKVLSTRKNKMTSQDVAKQLANALHRVRITLFDWELIELIEGSDRVGRYNVELVLMVAGLSRFWAHHDYRTAPEVLKFLKGFRAYDAEALKWLPKRYRDDLLAEAAKFNEQIAGAGNVFEFARRETA